MTTRIIFRDKLFHLAAPRHHHLFPRGFFETKFVLEASTSDKHWSQ